MKEKIKIQLPPRQWGLLKTVINDYRLFDKRDNTFKLSNRDTAKALKCSPSKIDQLHRSLRKYNLTKKVTVTIYQYINALVQLDPRFLYINNFNKKDYWFTLALYLFNDTDKVIEWRGVCKQVGYIVHPSTGEILEYLPWQKYHLKQSLYTCFDRCYRKGETSALNDLKLADSLCSYDLEWFKRINAISKKSRSQ